MLTDAERVLHELDDGGACASALAGLLAPAELDALRERIRRLLADPAMPSPRARRDLPWSWV